MTQHQSSPKLTVKWEGALSLLQIFWREGCRVPCGVQEVSLTFRMKESRKPWCQCRRFSVGCDLVHLAIYFTYSHSTGSGNKHGPHPINRISWVHLKDQDWFISITLERCLHSVKTNKPTIEWYLFNKYQILHPFVQSTRNTAEKNPCPCREETLEEEIEFTRKE